MSQQTPDIKTGSPVPDNESGGKPSRKRRKKRPAWLRVVRGLLFTLIVLVVILLAVITVAVSYLQPKRLTPLVEKYANEYLDADVTIGRVEISFWHTFPRFELDIDSLNVRSKALDHLPADVRNQLPAGADSLLSVAGFNGAINIPILFAGKIKVYDVEINHPAVTLVQATDSVSNLNIFPASDDDKESSSATIIPEVSLGTFAITGDMPVRYISLPDSTDIAVMLTTTSLNGAADPEYAIDIQGATSVEMPAIHLDNLGFGLGGEIEWKPSEPYKVSLSDFSLRAGDVETHISTDVDFDKFLRVNTFDFKLPITPLADIIALIPADMRGELGKVKSTLSIAASVQLTAPFTPSADSLPSFHLTLSVPEGTASYDRLQLKRFALEAVADVDGKNLDKSEVTIKKMLAIGPGVGFELNGNFTSLMSDPAVDATFKGGLEIDRLPKPLLAKLPCQLSGSLRADSRFSLRQSYLTKENFHRIRLTGDATLRNFHASMPELPAELYTGTVELKLGTNSSFTRGEASVDSLLTASLKIDTISASVTGMDLQAAGLKMGVGCQNTASSADTTLINPIGARIVADRIMFKSQEDSLRVRLRKSTVGATIRRFKGDTKKPQLHLDVATEGAFYADRVNRALLSKALLYVTAHPTTFTPRRSSPYIDSLRRKYPELSEDSIRTLVINRRQTLIQQAAIADSIAVAEGEALDITVDNSLRRLMRRWQAEGVLKAERMRVFTPYFPLRNVLSDLDMKFNSDSMTISETQMRSGRSSLVVNGTISNITKALTSRTGRQPLKMKFTMQGDTIDVNQIAAAAFAGATFAERDTTGLIAITADTEDEKELQSAVQTTDTDSIATLVVPSNIEANVDVNAKTILYSDLAFSNFHGNLNVYQGAINLEQMSARTTIGSIGLNALYSAPTKEDASFAFGLRVKDFHIGQFLNLVPTIDSIMPLLSDIDGIVNADIAATTDIDDGMNINIPSLKAVVKLSGDSLVLIDEETFRKVGKWLLFKHKERNVIDHMNVEMMVDSARLQLFPFIFDIDRYKLGVMGSNDMNMNLNYHIAVLKSPIPFKFGINLSGNIDDMKIRLGRAKFNEKNFPVSVSIADTTRINLVRQIGNIFRRGVKGAKLTPLNLSGTPVVPGVPTDASADTISHADSLYFIQQGVIPQPDSIPAATQPAVKSSKKSKKKK